MHRFATTLAAAFALASVPTFASALTVSTDDEIEPKFEVEELELQIDFSALADLTGRVAKENQRRGSWRGTFEDTRLEIELFALTKAEGFDFNEPSEVVELIAHNRNNRTQGKGNAGFEFQVSKALLGPLGQLPYGWLGIHDVYQGTKKDGHLFVFGGVTSTAGYFFEISSPEVFDDKKLAAFETWASACVVYTGATIDPEWTEDELEKRWIDSAPEKVVEKGRRQVLRTDYYIVFTNLGGGTARAFAKKVDENYEKVREVFPFGDMPGQRLLPIFYFTDRDQYLDWCVKNLGWDRAQAARSAGVATGDVYATYHQSVNAPVHIHEQTHQIFKNRLRLGGGGSWFQEGVAEYMSSKPAELNEVKRFASKDRTTPFIDFFVVPSLLMSSDKGSRKEGGSAAGGAYTQAAAVIEFAKHSDFGREKFLDWVQAMGSVGRGDLPAIRRGITRVYDVTLEDFEKEFKAYWSKRKMNGRDWQFAAPVDKKSNKKKKR